ncbi:B12-binding domain-containing radical SAM protein [Candidatus Omnitrophota bacterium]
MKVILVRPNYKSHIITPPLGIGYLASYLEKHRIEIKIIDGLRDRLNNKEILKIILDEKPDIVGISSLTAFYNETVDLCKGIKDHSIRCVIGGVHPTFLPYSTLLDTRADFVICGEAEIAFLKLIQNNFKNDGIPGVYSMGDLKSDDDVIVKAEVIQDLDKIPFPDWTQISPKLYSRAPYGAIVKNFPIGSMITTRGCPYECIFCASPGFCDRKIRFRSPENVVEEIKHLVKDFGVKEIQFVDDNITFKRTHIEQICNLIIQNKLKISWSLPSGVRADKIDKELVKLMVKSGCYYFSMGIESASPAILNNLKKHTTLETINKAIEIADKEGISCQGFFIFGLPGETRETIEETIDFARRSRLSRAQFVILDILPGSELWCRLKGSFKPDWNKNSYKEPEWIPEGLTREELMKAQAKAFRVFYFRFSIILKLVKFVRLRQIKFLIQRLRDYRIIKI